MPWSENLQRTGLPDPHLFCSNSQPSICAQIDLEGADLAEWRRQLAACTDPASICRFLLAVEEVYCHAGEGLPRGESNQGQRCTLMTLASKLGVQH